MVCTKMWFLKQFTFKLEINLRPKRCAITLKLDDFKLVNKNIIKYK